MTESLSDELRRLRVAVARRRGLDGEVLRQIEAATSAAEAHRIAVTALAVKGIRESGAAKSNRGLPASGALVASTVVQAGQQPTRPTTVPLRRSHTHRGATRTVEARAIEGASQPRDDANLSPVGGVALAVAVILVWNPTAHLPQWRDIAAIGLVVLVIWQRALQLRIPRP
jgi:hypothetical protein